jgi:hypothetical protein
MDKVIRFLGTLVVLVICYFLFFKESGPVAYNNELIDHQNDVVDKIDKFGESLEEGSSYGDRHRDLLEQIDSSLDELRQMPDYEGNTEFRDKMIELIEFYKSIAENEFVDLINMYNQGSFSDDDKELHINIWNNLSADEDSYFQDVRQAQETFARQFDLKLKKGKRR